MAVDLHNYIMVNGHAKHTQARCKDEMTERKWRTSMTEDYAERRRQYVAEIRDSFDRSGTNKAEFGNREADENGISFGKMKFLVSVGIFILFLFLKFDGSDFYGYQAKDIIEMVADNHYFTSLQEYVLEEEKKVN